MSSNNKKKAVQWTARVKSKKSGNRKQSNGTWSKGQYMVFSVSIPSEVVKQLDLKPGSSLKLRATIKEPDKKKEKKEK